MWGVWGRGCHRSVAFGMSPSAATTARSPKELGVSCLTSPLLSLILTVSFMPSGHPHSWSAPLP